jgi:hypothetical protein
MAQNTGIVYKIRDPKTGLFKLGGAYVRWSKHGKTWTARRHLTSHLTLMREHRFPIDPTWEVVSFVYTPGVTETVGDYLKGKS